MLYPLIRPLLFRLDPEQAHGIALKTLALAHKLKLMSWWPKPKNDPIQIMGQNFPNRIGLAAGFDKNGDYVDALSALGFGFIEIGTITKKPQEGNPKPRLFRLTKEEALINRMGFNNKGADYVAHKLAKTKYKGILGINIGKNKDTPLAEAHDDYLSCFRTLWPYASYITINISSPNTQGLRELQQGELFKNLIRAMKQEQNNIFLQHHRYVPLVVKISPDVSREELTHLSQIILTEKIDAVIATNTTLSRANITSSLGAQSGGLSGSPLQQRSTYIIKQLSQLLENNIPIIASGGVMDEQAIKEKISAGASLVQVYTGLIYRGPSMLRSV